MHKHHQVTKEIDVAALVLTVTPVTVEVNGAELYQSLARLNAGMIKPKKNISFPKLIWDLQFGWCFLVGIFSIQDN